MKSTRSIKIKVDNVHLLTGQTDYSQNGSLIDTPSIAVTNYSHSITSTSKKKSTSKSLTVSVIDLLFITNTESLLPVTSPPIP